MGCHFLIQGIFPPQGLNLGLPHCRQMLYPLSHQRCPILLRLLANRAHGLLLRQLWLHALVPPAALFLPQALCMCCLLHLECSSTRSSLGCFLIIPESAPLWHPQRGPPPLPLNDVTLMASSRAWTAVWNELSHWAFTCLLSVPHSSEAPWGELDLRGLLGTWNSAWHIADTHSS